jgi:hypothetical protein
MNRVAENSDDGIAGTEVLLAGTSVLGVSGGATTVEPGHRCIGSDGYVLEPVATLGLSLTDS